MTLAQEVAEAIHNDATSGMAVWDELFGPDAKLERISDTKYTVTLPVWDEAIDNLNWDNGCVITIESKPTP